MPHPQVEKPQGAAGPYTWEYFIGLPDEDRRELDDGHLVEMDMPTDPHEHIVAALIGHLYAWSSPRQAGWVRASGYKIRVSDKQGVMPDVQFYRKDNPARRKPQGLEEGRPDLAVEVVSPKSRTYDRVRKLNWYAALGVPEYWIVDPEERSLTRHLLRDGLYVIAEALEGSAVLRPDTFPGLEIPLAALWDSGTEAEQE
jgi:Uma2 family endonuclease